MTFHDFPKFLKLILMGCHHGQVFHLDVGRNWAQKEVGPFQGSHGSTNVSPLTTPKNGLHASGSLRHKVWMFGKPRQSPQFGGGGDPTPFFFTFVSPFCDSASVYYNVQAFFSSQILNSHLIQEILRCFHPFLPFKSLVRWAAVGCHYLNSYKHPRLITSKCGPCRHVGGYLCFG